LSKEKGARGGRGRGRQEQPPTKKAPIVLRDLPPKDRPVEDRDERGVLPPDKLPWLKVHVRDVLGYPGLALFTLPQWGALFRMILLSWQMPKVRLPKDPFALARLCLVEANAFRTDLWPALKPLFDVEGDYIVLREPINLRRLSRESVERYLNRKRGGDASAEARKRLHGTAQPSNNARPGVRRAVRRRVRPASGSDSGSDSSSDYANPGRLRATGEGWTGSPVQHRDACGDDLCTGECLGTGDDPS
jgi:hypothetical protein